MTYFPSVPGFGSHSSECGAIIPNRNALYGRNLTSAEDTATMSPAFRAAKLTGARCARKTGMRGRIAREWALRFAWAAVGHPDPEHVYHCMMAQVAPGLILFYDWWITDETWQPPAPDQYIIAKPIDIMGSESFTVSIPLPEEDLHSMLLGKKVWIPDEEDDEFPQRGWEVVQHRPPLVFLIGNGYSENGKVKIMNEQWVEIDWEAERDS